MITESITAGSFLLALAGGFLPAFIWLWFWLKEDEAPEPKRLLGIAFVGGMLAVPIALAAERILLVDAISSINIDAKNQNELFSLFTGLFIVGAAAFIEELLKYLAILSLIFWQADYDEPADAMIYLMTTALGFAAFENVLYLERSFSVGAFVGIAVSNLRFIGATLLHALSSGVLGLFIAHSFFKTRLRKELALFFGLFFATLLHTLFNLSILVGGERIEPTLVFLIIVGIFILFSFEQVKHTISKYYA